MAKPKKSVEDMDEDMKGLDHNGMLQRQWKMLKQVLEKNAGTETNTPNDASPDEASNDASEETENSKP